MKFVFKALRGPYSSGELYSANDSFAQEYKEGIINLPRLNGSKIFCFATFDQAKIFARCFFTRMSVYRCLADGVEKCPEMIPSPWSDLNSMWMNFRYWERDIDIVNQKTPHGSLLCDSLYLLEKVSDKSVAVFD